MNVYNIWADKKLELTDEEFVRRLTAFLDRLVTIGTMSGYRIMRMKLGFRSLDIPEFHIQMEFHSLADLDAAMTNVLEDAATDTLHVGFNRFVEASTMQHALYRDYPD